MNTPFTISQFLEVFKSYNLAVYPMQLFFYLLAIAAIYLSIENKAYSNKAISLILSFFWIWMGIVYHLVFFTAINKAAYLFGIIYILQGLLFFYFGFIKQQLSFKMPADLYGMTGALLIVFALIIYPLIGYFSDHPYPYQPTFGLPCPTTIFTLGILLWAEKKPSKIIFIIPILWSVIGFSAAFLLGVREDIGLLISGLLTTVLIIIRNRMPEQHKPGLSV